LLLYDFRFVDELCIRATVFDEKTPTRDHFVMDYRLL